MRPCLKKIQNSQVLVEYTFNPSTQVEPGGSQSQPGLQSKFQDSQGYTEHCFWKKKKKPNQTKNKQKSELK